MKFIFSFILLVAISHSANAFIPEASGGAMVNSTIVIAGDEEPSSLWLETNKSSLAKVKVNGAKWDDMEGLATVGSDKFFGTTSHSLTKKGKQRPEREQLILFSLVNGKVTALKSWSLRSALLSYMSKHLAKEIDLKQTETGTPDNGGLNIEGLASIDGVLYFGLRSPITKNGKAIVLTMTNAENSPIISGHFLLDLKNNGIRSLESDQKKLLILSGSTDDTDSEFGLYEMNTGVRVLSSISVNGFSNLLRPESMIKESVDSFVFLQDFQAEENQEVIVRLKR
jgi:hypothetical protein